MSGGSITLKSSTFYFKCKNLSFGIFELYISFYYKYSFYEFLLFTFNLLIFFNFLNKIYPTSSGFGLLFYVIDLFIYLFKPLAFF